MRPPGKSAVSSALSCGIWAGSPASVRNVTSQPNGRPASSLTWTWPTSESDSSNPARAAALASNGTVTRSVGRSSK